MAATNLINCLISGNFFLVLSFSIAPILIWFEFIFKEDKHPEPFYMILLAIFLGIISALLSLFAESKLYSLWQSSANYNFYFWSAFIEEFFKFFLIFVFIFQTRYFDELVDSMIYMGFSALGFGLLETFFSLCDISLKPLAEVINIPTAIILIGIMRNLSANFLHILASTLIGFGYAISLKTRRIFPFLYAFFISGFLHFLYNIFIIKDEIKFFIFPILWTIFLIVLLEFYIIKHNYGRD